MTCSVVIVVPHLFALGLDAGADHLDEAEDHDGDPHQREQEPADHGVYVSWISVSMPHTKSMAW